MGAFTLPIIVDTLGKVKVGLTSGTNYNATNRVLLKKNDTPVLAVQFVPNGLYTPFRLASNSIIQVALKEKGKYGAGSDYAASASTSVRPATDADPYLIALPISGAVIEALFGSAPTEAAYVDLMFEVTWSEDGSTFTSTTDPIEARVYNDVVRPSTLTPPIAPLLNVPQVYRDSAILAWDDSVVRKYDLAAIFGLKAGDIASFNITGGSATRGGTGPTTSDSSTRFVYFADVDLSNPLNYDINGDLMPFLEQYYDEPAGTAATWGVVTTSAAKGGLDTPNAVFKQATGFTFTFSHSGQGADEDMTAHCFLQIELLSVRNSVIA